MSTMVLAVLASVLDRLDAQPLEMRQVVLHGLELLGRVSLPIGDFADDPERIAGAVRLRRIARELLVGQVGIVLERAGRLDDVDPPSPLARRQLGAPDGGIQGGGQVDIRRFLPLAVVGGEAWRPLSGPPSCRGRTLVPSSIDGPLQNIREQNSGCRPGPYRVFRAAAEQVENIGETLDAVASNVSRPAGRRPPGPAGAH